MAANVNDRRLILSNSGYKVKSSLVTSHSKLRDPEVENKDKTFKVKSSQRPGAVFAEVSNLSTKISELRTPSGVTSFNRKSYENNSRTPTQGSGSKNLNSSHPPLARTQTPLQTPTSVGRTFQRNNNLQGSTPVTPKVTNKSKPTPLEASAKRRPSIKKSCSNLRSRVSVEDASNDRIASSPYLHGSADTPAIKITYSGSQAIRSNFRRVSSTRKSSSHQNMIHIKVPSVTSTPVSSNHFPSLESGETLNDFRLQQYDHPAEWDMQIDQEDESSAVTVGVRVRPINSREYLNPNIRNIIDIRGNNIDVRCENGSMHSFTYDHCFWSCDENHPSYTSQEDMYQEMAQPLLDHAFEGYNVCLFAYGQTGSGKSYCIMGEDNNFEIDPRGIPKESGVIPRFCQDLFMRSDEIHSNNGNQDVQNRIIVEISYIEIYNEKIYDLIGSQYPLNEREGEKILCHYPGGERREALRIREHPETGPYVVDASWHLVSTYQDLLTWLALGNNQRSIAATGMNDKSSRSHSVFSIKVTQVKKLTVGDEEMEHSLVSRINMVDLAGSERVAATCADGDRLKEGVSINKSLLTLGKVITALSENAGRRKTFIPYRESVLTWLLKESLGGNSKTAIIATVSPCNIYQEETLSTLRFACQAQKIVNWNHINEDPYLKIIKALKLDVEKLRAQQLKSPQCDFQNGYYKDDFEAKTVESVGGSCEREMYDKHLMKQVLIEEFEIKRVKEKGEFKANQKLVEEKLKKAQEQMLLNERIWVEKLRESELRKNEALERCQLNGIILKLEDNKPTLVNLCEDPQLSEMLLYSLKEGSTTLGQANSDVTLSGLHNNDIHCTIIHEGNKLILLPNENTETYINGKLVSRKTEIFHNDRIVFSGIYYFRVCYPTKERNPMREAEKKFDFLFARDEILKAQEERLHKELTMQQEASRPEMLRDVNRVSMNHIQIIKPVMSKYINYTMVSWVPQKISYCIILTYT